MEEVLGSNYEISYTNQAQARVKRYALQNVARDLLPGERVSWCMRHRVPDTVGVDVFYNTEHQCAHYGNLMQCGSVWMCPVCASKITERRRIEVEKVLQSGKYKTVFMVTLTLQHAPGDELSKLLDALNDTVRRLKMGNGWKLFRDRVGIIAYITGLEVTYGADGWHPHKHILLFSELSEGEIDLDAVREWFSERYRRFLKKSGKYASPIYGVDVRLGDGAVGRYVTKWGAAAEITKTPVKVGKGDNMTPFQLLDLAGMGDKQAAALFIEYSKAMKGRRLLSWSHGAREMFDLGEDLTDEELVEKEDERSERLLTLTPEQWHKVLGNDIRAELLEVASTGDALKVWNYLSQFGIDPTEHQVDKVLFFQG